MKKKLCVFVIVCLICSCFTGCQHHHDTIDVYNKSEWVFDNVNIKIKDGYFYDRHEKFTVDENTIGVTIYFTNEEVWD